MIGRRVVLGGLMGAPAKAIAAMLDPPLSRWLGSGCAGADEPVEVVPVQAFGAVGDGLTDDTHAIQAGIDAISGKRTQLFFPKGTYRVTPTGRHAWAGGSDMRAALLLRSDIHLIGQHGAVLKMADGISSDAAPADMALFFANDASGWLARIRLEQLLLDMNGSKNRQGHGLRNHAHIHVSGNGARIDDVFIKDCDFVDSAGTSCIVTGQVTSGVNHPLGKRWLILRCRFAGNGSDTIDHSSIFGWGEHITVENCDFSSNLFDPAKGNAGNTACEAHGANFRFINNRIHGGWLQGVWIAENATAAGDNILIENNDMTEIGSFGIAFFGQINPSMARPVVGAVVTRNRITLNATAYPGVDVKAGVCVASPFAQRGWRIAGNTTRVASHMATASTGVLVAGGLTGQAHAGEVRGNSAYGTTFGVALFTYAGGGIDELEVIGNEAHDLQPAGPIFKEAAGILVSGGSAPIQALTIKNNVLTQGRGTGRRTWGLHLGGQVARLVEGSNRVQGAGLLAREAVGLHLGSASATRSRP